MRREKANAGKGFRILVTGLRQCATDRFSAGVLVGGISAFVVAWLPTTAWLWIVGASLMIAWRLRQDEVVPRDTRRQSQDLYGNQALIEIAGKAAKLGGWVVHLPDRRIELAEETWAIHERPRGKTVTFEEGIGYFAPEWRDAITRHFETCVATGLPYDIEVKIIDGTGRRKWVRAIGVAIRDDMGHISRIQGALQDIDERKRLENTARDLERRLAESMENISDALFQLDTDWRFTYLNRQAERLLARPRSALMGRLIWQEFPEASSGIIRQHYERAVRESGGRIEIESEPGKGTTIFLSFLRLASTETPAEPVANGVLEGGSERILVVEDDPMVREFAAGTLVSLGYSVTCADDATEALQLLKTDGPFDLVFSDVAMPGPIDGDAMVAKIMTQYPNVPVVLATGYADVERIGTTSRFRPLAKPYTRRQLAETLRKVIDSSLDNR